MLIEGAIWLGISAFLHHALFRKKSDREKIDLVFENIKFGFKEQLPMHLETKERKRYTTYIYHLPYGLIDDPKLENILQKTLNKPAEIKMKNNLFINIYKHDLKNKYDYHFVESDNWQLPIGYALGDKVIYHDFDKIPHMTVAGMTRQGKTVLLKLILAHLIYNHPNDTEFYLIDLKGGLEFNQYRRLKQVRNVSDDVFSAKKTLSQVLKEIKKDKDHFKNNSYTNILDTEIKTRKFIIIDEAAELVPPSHLTKEEKQDYKYCQFALSEIARIAGALGYRLIFCTQYPTADTLPRQIKQNSDAKISFRLSTEVASRVAIDEQGAEVLTVPGRAIYRTHKKHVIQVPFVSDKNILKELGRFEVSDPTGEKEDEGRENTVTFG